MTNKEIASQVGVSPAALSLIINHKPGVSEATRARVLNELKELGYEHLIKSSAAAEPSNNLCFIIYKRHGEILDLHPFFFYLWKTLNPGPEATDTISSCPPLTNGGRWNRR